MERKSSWGKFVKLVKINHKIGIIGEGFHLPAHLEAPPANNNTKVAISGFFCCF